MSNPNEFVETAIKTFDFLIKEFGFEASIAKAQGTYHSEVVFTTDTLKITTGIWGQGNEAWIIFFPQDKNLPPLHFSILLNRITADETYFQKMIETKLPSPVFAQSYPQFLALCAGEMKRHCREFLTGDFSKWQTG